MAHFKRFKETIVLSPKKNWGCVILDLHAILSAQTHTNTHSAWFGAFGSASFVFYRWKYSFNQTELCQPFQWRKINLFHLLSPIFFASSSSSSSFFLDNLEQFANWFGFSKYLLSQKKTLETSFRRNSIEMGDLLFAEQTQWRTRFVSFDYEHTIKWNFK